MKYKASHFEIFRCFLCGEESNTTSSHYNERNAPSGKRRPYRVVCCCCGLVLSRVWLFCDYVDCNPLGFSVPGISQARILEWVAISFSRWSSWPRDGTHVSYIGKQILHHWVIREASTILCQTPKQRLHKYHLIFITAFQFSYYLPLYLDKN